MDNSIMREDQPQRLGWARSLRWRREARRARQEPQAV